MIEITTPDGKSETVDQIQTKKWVDLSAPEDTKILRDLVDKAWELNKSKKGENIKLHTKLNKFLSRVASKRRPDPGSLQRRRG